LLLNDTATALCIVDLVRFSAINADDKLAHLKGGNLVVFVVFVHLKPSG